MNNLFVSSCSRRDWIEICANEVSTLAGEERDDMIKAGRVTGKLLTAADSATGHTSPKIEDEADTLTIQRQG